MNQIYSGFFHRIGIISMENLKIKSLFLSLMLFANFAYSQSSYSISGKVTDNMGSIPGASVKITGTNFGASTDLEGNYKINATLAPGSYKIVFSGVGYSNVTQNLTLGNSPSVVVDAVLKEDALNLDEVVVVGSTVKESRRQLGNAISTIKTDELLKGGSSNLVNSLQGKVPGAQITQNSGDPAGGVTIRLRGVKSLQGSSDPLYVIDGVIASNNSVNVSQTALSAQIGTAVVGTNRLADLNPLDIESINVINGAAAAAQYGSRAANGVVIITTKKGKSGAPRISFNTSVSTFSLRKKMPFSTYGKQFGFTGLRLHTIGGISAAQIAANPGTTVTGIVRDGVTANLATNLVDVTRYDYQDQIFQTGMGTENGLSISGGNDRTSYYGSVNYSKNEGIIVGTDFTRYGLRTRIDQKLNNWARFTVGLSYTNSFSNEKANGNVFYSPINSINITNNIWDITKRDAAGSLLAVEPTRVNPLSTIEDMVFTQAVNRTINDFQLNLTPVKGLSIDWLLGVDAYSQLGKNLIKPYPYQSVAGLPAERYPQGFASSTNNLSIFYNSDLNVGYEKALTEGLKLNLLAGYSYQYGQSDFTRASGERLAPFIESLNGGSVITAGYGLDRYNLSGVFGQATIGLKDRAFLTAALRRDKSSKFSETETNQFYPKVSASIIPSDFSFWKEGNLKNVINSMKIRASWGQAGNLTGIGSYDRFWQFNPVNYLGKNTIIPSSQLANASVRPERMTEMEAGIDVSLLNDKLGLTFTAYNQSISDLVVNAVTAATTGGTSIVNNTGEMSNKGIELGLNFGLINKKDFTWDASILFNRNRSKVEKLGTALVGVTNVAGAPIFLVEGEAPSVFFGVPYARDANGELILTSQGFPQRERGTQNGAYYTPGRGSDGQPTGANVNGIIGNPNPKWTGSISSNLKYKKLGFNFLLDAVQGLEVFNADFRTRQGVGVGEIAEQELKGELPRGYIFANYLIEEWRIDDGSYVKLRELGLSYEMPKLGKLTNWNLSLTGRNLISFDNYRGYDPETNAGGNSDLFRGVDFGNVPIPRSFKLQLTASF
ncbi:MAG: SusC/RagA family TonB-linked outer membrane protein [Spirosomataceae bacterium]